MTDSLTGLGNRLHPLDRLDAKIAEARNGGVRLALLLIDLDGLKEVNETLGHYEARGRECPYVANAGAAVDRASPLAGPAMSVCRRQAAPRVEAEVRIALGWLSVGTTSESYELAAERAGSFRFEPAEREPTSGRDLIARVRRVIDRAPARRPKQSCRRSWLPSRARRESDTSGHAVPASAPLLRSMPRSGEESPER